MWNAVEIFRTGGGMDIVQRHIERFDRNITITIIVYNDISREKRPPRTYISRTTVQEAESYNNNEQRQ